MDDRFNGDETRTGAVDVGTRPFVIALPEPGIALGQDQEWCLVRLEDEWREVRFHDYAEVYEIEGLYEHIFYKTLGCNSPEVIVGLLYKHMNKPGSKTEPLRVLDLGAGNGMVGERLREIGAECIVGVDIVQEAAVAAERDRPHVYDGYLIADMTDLSPEEERELRDYRFNCLTCVAALGFGDIPSDAFLNSFRLLSDGGWIAFNIKDRFLQDREPSGFSKLISSMIESGTLEIVAEEKYVHRRSTSGKPLEYVAIVGRKRAEV